MEDDYVDPDFEPLFDDDPEWYLDNDSPGCGSCEECGNPADGLEGLCEQCTWHAFHEAFTNDPNAQEDYP